MIAIHHHAPAMHTPARPRSLVYPGSSGLPAPRFALRVRSRRRGSLLVAVIIISAVAILFAGSLLNWSLTERRMNIRNALVLESRNAAEALAEYGFSQIRQKYETRGWANLDPSGSDALQMPPTSFWANSHVSTAGGDLEIVGGTVQSKSSTGSSYYYVDPDNPNNANDPLKGKWVWRRDVSVIAKATVKHSTGAPITSYATQSISVRGAPLFAHAIFYNMDLELAPGPEMHIYGPVHANGDLYLAHQSDNGSLNFHGQVTASGNLYHAWKYGIQGSHNKEGAIKNGHVNFANRDGTLISIRSGSKAPYTWKDSLMGGTSLSSEFRAYASSTWNGNLLTGAHGITNYNPVAIGEYREASPTNPSVAAKDSSQAPSNAGRQIIEPTSYPTDTSAPDYASRMETEAQKYANDAGVYIKVIPATTVGGTPTITVSSRDKQTPTKNKTITMPVLNKVVKYGAYKATATYTSAVTKKTPQTQVAVGAKETGSSNPNRNKYKVTTTTSTLNQTTTTTYTRTIGSAGYTDAATGSSTGGTTTTNSNTGTPVYMTASELSAAGLSANDTKTTYGTATNTAPSVSALSGLALAADNAGIYDRRRGKGVDLIDIDMDGLRKAVAAMSGLGTTKLSNGSNSVVTAVTDGFGGLTSADWTGIVYVEVVGGPTTDPTTGATNYGSGALATAADATAVRIMNGKGKVPSYGTANEGLTIATNTSMYVQGNYNTDGTVSTASSTHSAHVPESGEVPAALVADSITLLSEGFDLSKTMTTNKPGSSGTVEISAALLMGITPTNAGNNKENSGGAHNFPRFLEQWNHATYIRGSLVALFESRVATEPWSTDYYGPPGRNWGFNDLFASGRYPPGTPRVMSYRRVDFTGLDATEYANTKKGFNW